MPASVKKACKALESTVNSAQNAWAARQRELGVVSEDDSRKVDQEADTVWGALRARLSAYSVLPAEQFPRAARAGELVTMLFGDGGLSFLKDPYPVQFSTMDTILKRITEDKLQKEIDELAGPEFVQAIRNVHPRYDTVVHAMLRRDETSGQNLLDHVRAVQRAIVVYATKVCATVEDDEQDTIDVACAALRPIEQMRALSARRGGTPGSPAPGQTPAQEGTPA
jgi:hypothetical protein